MSRCYEVSVDISDFNHERESQIIQAWRHEWAATSGDIYRDDVCGVPTLHGCAFGTLYFGEGPTELEERLSNAIWQANGAVCPIEFSAILMT